VRQFRLQRELSLAVIGALAQNERFHDAAQRILGELRVRNTHRLLRGRLIASVNRPQFPPFQPLSRQQYPRSQTGSQPRGGGTSLTGELLQPIISVSNLTKTYASGFHALQGINLQIHPGEIFALLGPNGAGKTTLISIICGIVNPSSGVVLADGHDIIRDFRAARARIGLVPQELTTDAFESVWDTVKFSRGLFGKAPNPAYLEKVLRDLSLWEKKDSKILTLSGGMKRRVMIAKALSHEPRILFLDEPTAGVDVELRRAMWDMVRSLRRNGVTIILTTHYIQEAQEMADRIGVISKGEIILVEDKAVLMKKLGRKKLTLQLRTPLGRIPDELANSQLEISADGAELVYTFDTQGERTGIATLLSRLSEHGIAIKDLQTSESSLEDIFVSLVRSRS
jgi:ABC-2 type transport system ATP-binding protein